MAVDRVLRYFKFSRYDGSFNDEKRRDFLIKFKNQIIYYSARGNFASEKKKIEIFNKYLDEYIRQFYNIRMKFVEKNLVRDFVFFKILRTLLSPNIKILALHIAVAKNNKFLCNLLFPPVVLLITLNN